MGEFNEILPILLELVRILLIKLGILTHLPIKKKNHNLGIVNLVLSMVSIDTIPIIVPYYLEPMSYGMSPRVETMFLLHNVLLPPPFHNLNHNVTTSFPSTRDGVITTCGFKFHPYTSCVPSSDASFQKVFMTSYVELHLQTQCHTYVFPLTHHPLEGIQPSY